MAIGFFNASFDDSIGTLTLREAQMTRPPGELPKTNYVDYPVRSCVKDNGYWLGLGTKEQKQHKAKYNRGEIDDVRYEKPLTPEEKEAGLIGLLKCSDKLRDFKVEGL